MPDYLPNQPSYGSPLEWQPRRITHQFGDGYRQLSPDGLNPTLDKWSLTFPNITLAQADTLEAFLRNHITEKFYWVPEFDSAKYTPQYARNLPTGYATPKLWVVESFSRVPTSHRRFTIQATIQEEVL